MKDHEHKEQVALFTWANIQSKTQPELELLFAIPNGGHRHPLTAKKLKAEGVKSGVPDICLPIAKNGFHGLWIELKRPNIKGQPKGTISDNQTWWIEALKMAGSQVHVCFGWDEAKKAIIDYLTPASEA